MNNAQILKDGAVTTSTITSGLLSPEQSKQFLVQIFENTVLGGMIRRETRRAKTGELDKIGIDSRILRKKTEDVDAKSDGTAPAAGESGYRAKPNFAKIEYATTAVRLPWEITEESLRENIEGEGFEATVTNLMTTQLGVDMEDLCINADSATPNTDTDYDFLKINNGWLKLIAGGGHVEDRTSKNSGAMNLNVYYDALKQMPNKYNNGSLKWFMAPSRRQEWDLYLFDKFLSGAGGIAERLFDNPASIPVVEVPRMPEDQILLVNPKNLIVVNTYDIIIRKTTEGKEAVMQDKRFYTVHLDFDCVVEEMDAAVLITGLK